MRSVDKKELIGLKLEGFHESAYRAYSGTSFSPEVRAFDFVKSYSSLLLEDLKIIKEFDADLERYESKFKEYLSIWLSAKSRCMSSMITGPANFPVERNRKNNDYEHSAYEKFDNWRNKVINKITKPENTDIIKGSDGAIEKMIEKLSGLEKLQNQMKSSNKIIKSKKFTDDEKISKLSFVFPLFTDEKLIEIKDLMHYNTPGFAGFELTNNNAKIKSLRKSIKSETERLSKYTEGNKEYTINRIHIVENVTENRLQLLFGGKHTEEIRTELKANGYRYSPRFEAWQRQLTNNAIGSLKRLSFLN